MALWRNWYGARGFLRASRAPRRPAEPRGESRSVQGAAGTPVIWRDCVHSPHCRHNRLGRLGWLCRRSRPKRLYRPCRRSQGSLPSRLCPLCWFSRLCQFRQLSRLTRLSRTPLGGGGGPPHSLDKVGSASRLSWHSRLSWQGWLMN